MIISPTLPPGTLATSGWDWTRVTISLSQVDVMMGEKLQWTSEIWRSPDFRQSTYIRILDAKKRLKSELSLTIKKMKTVLLSAKIWTGLHPDFSISLYIGQVFILRFKPQVQTFYGFHCNLCRNNACNSYEVTVPIPGIHTKF